MPEHAVWHEELLVEKGQSRPEILDCPANQIQHRVISLFYSLLGKFLVKECYYNLGNLRSARHLQ